MHCIIATPTQTQNLRNIISVTIPTHIGQTQIKPGHAEYITNTVAGTLCYTNIHGKEVQIEIQKGVCHVLKDTIRIII